MKLKRLFSFLLLFLLPLSFIGAATQTQAKSYAIKTYKGIDVSEWQGTIDFHKVKDSGINLVYIRTGSGSSYVDSKFEDNYKKAKEVGLKIGYYHYVTATTKTEAEEQAKFFYSLIKEKTIDCYPAMDFEVYPGLSDQQINEIAKTFLSTLSELLGYHAAIYTDANNVKHLWSKELSSYPLWIADYSIRTPDNIGHWSSWAGFQYSDRGVIGGIKDHVDMDYFRDSILVPNHTSNNTHHNTSSHYFTYEVKRGDTLYRIAKRYHTTVEKICDLNHITNPNFIRIGQHLHIPK